MVIPNQADSKLRIFNLLDIFSIDSTSLPGKIASDFVYSNDATRGTPITMWVVGDLDSAEGRRVAKDALRHLQVSWTIVKGKNKADEQTDECSSRIGFVHVPTPSASPTGERFSTLLFHLFSNSGLSMTEPDHLLSLLDELDTVSDNLDGTWRAWSEGGSLPPGSPLHAFTSRGWDVADEAAAAKFWSIGTEIADKLGLRDGRPHLLVNGRVSLTASFDATARSSQYSSSGPSLRRTSPLATLTCWRCTSTGNAFDQSSISSRRCTTTCPGSIGELRDAELALRSS